MDFPGGLGGKGFVCNAGDVGGNHRKRYICKILGNINSLLGDSPIILGWCNIIVVSDCEF